MPRIWAALSLFCHIWRPENDAANKCIVNPPWVHVRARVQLVVKLANAAIFLFTRATLEFFILRNILIDFHWVLSKVCAPTKQPICSHLWIEALLQNACNNFWLCAVQQHFFVLIRMQRLQIALRHFTREKLCMRHRTQTGAQQAHEN